MLRARHGFGFLGFGLAVAAALVVGCTNTSPASIDAVVAQTGNGPAIFYGTAESFEIKVDATFDNVCALQQAGDSHVANSQYFAVYWTGASGPATATYSLSGASPTFSIEHRLRDATCQGDTLVATSGNVTITSFSDRGAIAGSFVADFPTLGTVTRTFTAPFCDDSVSTGPTTCEGERATASGATAGTGP